MLPLSDLHRCFQGVLPAVMTTCAADGTPNVTYLSQVHLVDDRHVALSCQFFNKTRQNVGENPRACVHVSDPTTLDTYELDLRYDHSETTGALFDTMSTRIQAIASHTGMAGVFRLLSADVYEVLTVNPVPALAPETREEDEHSEPVPSLRTEVRALTMIAERVRRAADLDALLSALLEAIREGLGFDHSMVLLLDETGERLFTVASLGYGDRGIGAEVLMGEGLIGTVAKARTTVRLGHVEQELRYGRAIRHSAKADGGTAFAPEIPLAGLPDAQSQMAIPLLSRDRLLGVLAVESPNPLGFNEWHEAFLDVVGNQVATAIENIMLRAEAEGRDGDRTLGARRPGGAAAAVTPIASRIRHFCFYRNDDCVFVDDAYLVRNVPGRILWKILRCHVETGRTEFSNREFRLDPSLGLPPIKDNLESRLILLRRRLEEKCPDLRMVSCGRGQFRLELDCALRLTEKDSG